MLTRKDILTASGRYPDRENHVEVTPEVLANIDKLLNAVNSLLNELGLASVKVSSGFRPSAVNAGIAGAAKKSLHMRGMSVDLVDTKGQLAKVITSKPELLRKYGLFVENPAVTVGWLHLDIGVRSDRPSRMFNP